METIIVKTANNFEFQKDKNSLYPDYYPASIALQVGNSIGNTVFRLSNEECKYDNPFTSLEESGLVKLDFSEVEELYMKLAEGVKRKNEDIKLALDEKAYKSEWIHKVKMPDIVSQKGMIVTVTSFKNYQKQEWNKSTSMKLTYKEYTATIRKTTIGDRYSVRGRQVRYELDCYKLLDSSRKYGKPETAIEKFIELADERIKSNIRAKKSAEQEEKKRQQRLAYLKEIFGEVEMKREYRYSRYGNSGYHVTEYRIIKGDRRLRLNFRVDHETNMISGYELAGIENLSSEQVKTILNVL